MSHPESSGLRILADELDALAVAGVIVPGITLEIRFTRNNRAAVCEGLKLDPQPINGDRDAYNVFTATRTIDGLYVNGWGFLNDLCVKRTVMVSKEVWTCGDDEFEMKP